MADGGRLPFCLSFLSVDRDLGAAPVAVALSAILAVDDAPGVVVVGARRLHGVGRSEKATAPRRTWSGSC
jgi:hypothetical protein